MLTEFCIAIETVVSERAWGSIVRARVEERGHARYGRSIRVKALSKAMLGTPAVGEVWRVTGVISDTEWGPQLDAQRAVREVPTGRLIEAFLAANVPGIGTERAARLWNRWGMEVSDVLADDARIADIAEVIAPDRPTFGLALAASCTRAWREAVSSTRTLLWLAKRGFEDLRLSRQIVAILGDSAIEILQANPYVLVSVVGWGKLDEAALDLLREAGVEQPRRDPRRLVGAVDAAIKKAILEGHTAADHPALSASVAKHLGVGPTSSVMEQAMLLAERAGAIVRAGELWRAPGCAAMEDHLVACLGRMLDCDYPSAIELPSIEGLQRKLSVMRVSGHVVHPEQQRAVQGLLQMPLAILQGGAGVGKTTTLMAVCDLWANAGGAVVCSTISGKAALRLSRATGRLAMTLARLLSQLRERERIEAELQSVTLSGEERTRAEIRRDELVELSPRTLVVIDEASMVDLGTAHELVRRLPLGARLLLVGDEAQLPPVGFGLVYHRLVGDPALTVRLTTVHRQTTESGIPAISASIRDGKLPALPAYGGRGDGVSFLASSGDDLQASVVRVWDDLGGREGGALICTATKSGHAGINALNQLLQRRRADLTGLATVKGYYSHWYCAGDPVVWLRNDYARGLFNGMLGHVLRADPEEGLTVQFEGFNAAHEVSTEQLIDLALAYAITCHRAQGSQAPAVVVPLYESKVLDPSWLYTAVTRAERQVVLVGDPAVMSSALAKPWAARRRQVGLNW